MDPVIIIIPLFFTIAVIIIVAILFFHKRQKIKQRNFFAEIASGVAIDSLQIVADGHSLQGLYQGRFISCNYFAGSKNSPSSFTISLTTAAPAPITIKKEGSLERLSKGVGLTAEIQTRDPLFDKKYFLDTEQPDLYQNYFYSETNREAINKIFAVDFPVSRVEFTKERLNIVISPFHLTEEKKLDLRLLLDQLTSLSSDLQTLKPDLFIGQSARPGKANIALPVIITVLSVIGGVILMIAGISDYEPLRYSFVLTAFYYIIPALIVFLVLTFSMIRGKSSSHIAFILIMVFAVGGFILSGIGGMIFSNGYLDESPVVEHTVTITDRHYTRNKNSTSYYLLFPSWNFSQENEKISVDRSLYNSLDIGKQLVITTKPGYWKQDWIVSLKAQR